MHQGPLRAYLRRVRRNHLKKIRKRIVRAKRADKKLARDAKRAAKRRLANQMANARMFPQSDVQAHLVELDKRRRDNRQPHPDPRTKRRKKTRGPLNKNGGRRGKNKTNGKALLRAAFRAM